MTEKGYPVVQVKEAIWVEDNEEQIGGKQYRRYVITPSSDYSAESQEVKTHLDLLFTQEVKGLFNQANQEVS